MIVLLSDTPRMIDSDGKTEHNDIRKTSKPNLIPNKTTLEPRLGLKLSYGIAGYEKKMGVGNVLHNILPYYTAGSLNFVNASSRVAL